MFSLKLLRRLVDRQQFPELKGRAQQYLAEAECIGALALLGIAYAHLGERDEALACCRKIESSLAEIDLNVRVDLAGLYCLLGHIDSAVQLLEPAVAEHPAHALALARLAFCRLQQGRPEDALRLYQASAAHANHRLPVWVALARLQLGRGAQDEAHAALVMAVGQLAAQEAVLPVPTFDLFTEQLRGLQLEVWVASADLARAEHWLGEQRGPLGEHRWTSLILDYVNLLAGRDQHAEAEDALRDALTHFPDNLALISQHAELAQLQGRTLQVIQMLNRSIQLAKAQDKPEAGLWVRLSSACLHQMNGKARTAASKALALAQAMQESEATPLQLIVQLRLQAKTALAQVESQEQNFGAAETLFREVLDEAPWFLAALRGLGQQQMQVGKIDESIGLFERIRAIDPAAGYSSLINVRQFPQDVQTLVRMEAAARQPTLEGAVRSGLLLQLAAAWEKHKDYAKAFALATEANETSKKFLHYDARAHRLQCARTRHAFCRPLYENRPGCGVDSTLPVFVLGMPRSGTTLVEQILAGHSQIFGAGELGIIPARIEGLNRWERHTGTGRAYPDCVDDLSPYVTHGIANGVLDELRQLALTDKPEAKHVVDKLPHNFENIGFIRLLFPNAKIISVRRDPRDIAISNYFTDYQAKHGGMGFAYDLGWIGEQLADHNLLMHHWHQLFPGGILEINYEEVVEDTEVMARKMLEYIGVAWEPQVLNFNELDRPVKTASVWQVRQPIYKTSKDKWRRYEQHLGALIAGTNKKIEWEPIDMLTLPEPGLLNRGVALYKEDKLDEAEYEFKKLLHHLPEHAAANYMLGLVYARKNHLSDAIALMVKALEKCPWNLNWRKELIQAYTLTGQHEKADALKPKANAAAQPPDKETGGAASDMTTGFSEAMGQ